MAYITGEDIYNFRLKNKHLTWQDIADHYGDGLTDRAVRGRYRRYCKNNGMPKIEFEERQKEQKEEYDSPPPEKTHKVNFKDYGQRAEAYSVSDRIQTLDQLLDACDADLNKWRVSRYVVNVWEMGRKKKYVDLTYNNGVADGYINDTGDWQLTDLWQVKAWLEPRTEEPYESALNGLIEEVKKHAPRYEAPKMRYSEGEYLLVPNIYDVHLGKRSKNGNYTVSEAAHDFIRTAEAIVATAQTSGRKIGRIMFPVGNDMLHADNLFEKTTRGTWVEMSANMRDVIDAACTALSSVIETFATIGPVDVIPVEGNHDRLQVYWLSKYLQAFFSNHTRVTVQKLTCERQYYQWGKVGLGLTHNGNKPIELATLFPVEARKMWSEIKWSEWLTGHFHKERGALYMVDSVRGTVVRTIPALCDTDTFHSLHMFVGEHRAAETLYYHKHNGPAGIFPVFVSEL